MNKKELENRLVGFAVGIIGVSNANKSNYAGKHLSGQIIRSGTSVPLNYGEAQSAESKRDFIHKMQIILKELRETMVNLLITQKAGLNTKPDQIDKMIKECNELVAIFVKSIQTAKKRKE